MQESTSPWLVRHLLQETQSTQRPLIAVECQQTVKEVMELLHRHRIQACPVRTAHTDQFVNGEQEFCLVHGWLYIGIVSQLDLLLFMHRHGESGGQGACSVHNCVILLNFGFSSRIQSAGTNQ